MKEGDWSYIMSIGRLGGDYVEIPRTLRWFVNKL